MVTSCICFKINQYNYFRSHIPLWWSVRRGGLREPERHQHRGPQEAVGPHLQLRPRPPGLRAPRLGRQAGELARWTAGAVEAC